MAQHRVTLRSRFWRQVARAEGCWLWLGAITGTGYGAVSVSGRTEPAHRVAWALSNGPLPSGARVRHACTERRCVRPDHLQLEP